MFQNIFIEGIQGNHIYHFLKFVKHFLNDLFLDDFSESILINLF